MAGLAAKKRESADKLREFFETTPYGVRCIRCDKVFTVSLLRSTPDMRVHISACRLTTAEEKSAYGKGTGSTYRKRRDKQEGVGSPSVDVWTASGAAASAPASDADDPSVSSLRPPGALLSPGIVHVPASDPQSASVWLALWSRGLLLPPAATQHPMLTAALKHLSPFYTPTLSFTTADSLLREAQQRCAVAVASAIKGAGVHVQAHVLYGLGNGGGLLVSVSVAGRLFFHSIVAAPPADAHPAAYYGAALETIFANIEAGGGRPVSAVLCALSMHVGVDSALKSGRPGLLVFRCAADSLRMIGVALLSIQDSSGRRPGVEFVMTCNKVVAELNAGMNYQLLRRHAVMGRDVAFPGDAAPHKPRVLVASTPRMGPACWRMFRHLRENHAIIATLIADASGVVADVGEGLADVLVLSAPILALLRSEAFWLQLAQYDTLMYPVFTTMVNAPTSCRHSFQHGPVFRTFSQSLLDTVAMPGYVPEHVTVAAVRSVLADSSLGHMHPVFALADVYHPYRAPLVAAEDLAAPLRSFAEARLPSTDPTQFVDASLEFYANKSKYLDPSGEWSSVITSPPPAKRPAGAWRSVLSLHPGMGFLATAAEDVLDCCVVNAPLWQSFRRLHGSMLTNCTPAQMAMLVQCFCYLQETDPRGDWTLSSYDPNVLAFSYDARDAPLPTDDEVLMDM